MIRRPDTDSHGGQNRIDYFLSSAVADAIKRLATAKEWKGNDRGAATEPIADPISNDLDEYAIPVDENYRVEEREITELIVEREGSEVVSARNLHGFLEVKCDFSGWIKRRIEKYRFKEGIDFFVQNQGGTSLHTTLAKFCELSGEQEH